MSVSLHRCMKTLQSIIWREGVRGYGAQLLSLICLSSDQLGSGALEHRVSNAKKSLEAAGDPARIIPLRHGNSCSQTLLFKTMKWNILLEQFCQFGSHNLRRTLLLVGSRARLAESTEFHLLVSFCYHCTVKNLVVCLFVTSSQFL